MDVQPGHCFALGATPSLAGTNFAVYSEVADAVEVCLFDESGAERRVELPGREADVFHGFFDDVRPGQCYGLRVHGPWMPEAGLRCNPAKLLLDPYATAIDGNIKWGQEVFSHRFEDPCQADRSDSAAAMPRCVVTGWGFDWGDDRPPRTPLSDTIVYETHVKGLTARHPDVPPEIRGTYAGLAHPAMIEYLKNLGITAVELLPVHQFAQDSHLGERGLSNYWGYNTMAFLAPHGEYSSSGTAGQQVAEFKSMVRTLHAAGLEVILDVVFNHTAEGSHLGPTLSLKGIDNRSYYRLVDEDPFHYFDTTGTGNSLNVGHPAALRLIMDSLRYWVSEMHVDGFRFDLATALTRQHGHLDMHSAFLTLVHQDPVLAPVKLIAEPWDVGGYQLGGFPARWSEWNGKYRDGVRDFWRGEEGTVGELAQRLTGSGDIYASRRRTPTASVNFVTAHDGFTLADLVAYNDKHNEANGEDNGDGESDNRSWNCGEEGPSADPDVTSLRARQRRNLLATLLLSAGVPMILGGDEIGRTQYGNNNAYCQDNELSWHDWDAADLDMLEFAQAAISIRRAHGALRPREYLRGPEGGPDQLSLYRLDGGKMTKEDWENPSVKTLAVSLNGQLIEDEDGGVCGDSFLLFVNANHEAVDFVVPGRRAGWEVVLSTSGELAPGCLRGTDLFRVESRCLVLLRNPPTLG